MKLNYNGEEIELRWSFRASVYFEQIQGKNIDFTNITSNDLLILFYCAFISTLQKNKMPIISLTDFCDVIDDNGGEKCLYDFSNWYVKSMTTQYEFLASTEEPNQKKTKGGPEAAKKNN